MAITSEKFGKIYEAVTKHPWAVSLDDRTVELDMSLVTADPDSPRLVRGKSQADEPRLLLRAREGLREGDQGTLVRAIGLLTTRPFRSTTANGGELRGSENTATYFYADATYNNGRTYDPVRYTGGVEPVSTVGLSLTLPGVSGHDGEQPLDYGSPEAVVEAVVVGEAGERAALMAGHLLEISQWGLGLSADRAELMDHIHASIA